MFGKFKEDSFYFSNAEIHGRAVNAVRNLLGNHDIDARFSKDPECKARVANLYLPLVGIMIDNMTKLYAWHAEGETRIAGTSNQNEHLTAILTAISDNVPNVSHFLPSNDSKELVSRTRL